MWIQVREDKVKDVQYTSQDFELSYIVRLHLPFQQQCNKMYNTNLKHDDWMLL